MCRIPERLRIFEVISWGKPVIIYKDIYIYISTLVQKYYDLKRIVNFSIKGHITTQN